MAETITLENGEVINLGDYPLPEGIEDDFLNKSEIALAMSVSEVTISKWIGAGMPVHQAGGNGRSYEFQLSHCYAWRCWRERSEADARADKIAKANQMAMHFMGDDGETPHDRLSPEDIKRWSEAELQRNKAALQRGELVYVDQVERALEDVMIAFRTSLTNLPDWLEQEFTLSAHQVAQAQDFCDGVLSEARRLIEQAGFESGGEVVRLQRQDAAEDA